MPDEQLPDITSVSQMDVLRFIHKKQTEQHEAPTLGEIQMHMKHVSHTGAVQITNALIIAGVLRQPFPKYTARNFALTGAGKVLLKNG